MRASLSHPTSARTAAANESLSPASTNHRGRSIARLSNPHSSANRQAMNRSFPRRLHKAAHDIARLPQRAYTDAENHQWAEQIIAEIMEEHNLSREEALGVVR